VWFVNHWLLLPFGTTIQTSPPSGTIAPLVPPGGYKRLFHDVNGKILFKTPETTNLDDVPILLGNTTAAGWVLVPEASEVAAGGTVTLR